MEKQFNIAIYFFNTLQSQILASVRVTHMGNTMHTYITTHPLFLLNIHRIHRTALVLFYPVFYSLNKACIETKHRLSQPRQHDNKSEQSLRFAHPAAFTPKRKRHLTVVGIPHKNYSIQGIDYCPDKHGVLSNVPTIRQFHNHAQ